jgi:hypothetical protein
MAIDGNKLQELRFGGDGARLGGLGSWHGGFDSFHGFGRGGFGGGGFGGGRGGALHAPRLSPVARAVAGTRAWQSRR